MFQDNDNAVAYRSQCGTGWHRLFARWESQQKNAMRDDSTKAIVWRCAGSCGGFGDRLRGILTSFALALVTDRAFFIDHPNPAPLQDFFQVAKPHISWVFNQSLLQGRSVLEENFLNHVTPPLGLYSQADLTSYEAYDVVVQINNFWRPFDILHNPSLRHVDKFRALNEHTLAGCMLNYLLVPMPDLQRQVQDMKQAAIIRQQHVLAVQVRTGDSQSKNETLLKELLQYYELCIQNLQTTGNETYQLFLTTDAEQVLELMKDAHPDMISFAGQIFHVDGNFGAPDSPHAAFKKVILDHLMISQSHKLIISRSGFAELAAVRGFKSYHTPLDCDGTEPVPHYEFHVEQPKGVDAQNCLDDNAQPHRLQLNHPLC